MKRLIGGIAFGLLLAIIVFKDVKDVETAKGLLLIMGSLGGISAWGILK